MTLYVSSVESPLPSSRRIVPSESKSHAVSPVTAPASQVQYPYSVPHGSIREEATSPGRNPPPVGPAPPASVNSRGSTNPSPSQSPSLLCCVASSNASREAMSISLSALVRDCTSTIVEMGPRIVETTTVPSNPTMTTAPKSVKKIFPDSFSFIDCALAFSRNRPDNLLNIFREFPKQTM